MVKKEPQGEKIDLEDTTPSAVSHTQLQEENIKLKKENEQLRLMANTMSQSIMNLVINADINLGDAKKICMNALNILNPQQNQAPGQTEGRSNNKAN